MPKPPEDDDAEDGDESESWKHDDPTERSTRQRRADDVRRQSESAAHTYQKTKELWEQILRNLQHPWKQL